MQKYKRINEDFLDRELIDATEKTTFLEDVFEEIREFASGKRRRLSFDTDVLPDAFYKPKDKGELEDLIAACTKRIGPDASLNWIDVSEIDSFYYLFQRA